MVLSRLCKRLLGQPCTRCIEAFDSLMQPCSLRCIGQELQLKCQFHTEHYSTFSCRANALYLSGLKSGTSRAILVMDTTRERWWAAETYRLKDAAMFAIPSAPLYALIQSSNSGGRLC